jgi:hypothetical protein
MDNNNGYNYAPSYNPGDIAQGHPIDHPPFVSPPSNNIAGGAGGKAQDAQIDDFEARMRALDGL